MWPEVKNLGLLGNGGEFPQELESDRAIDGNVG